MSVPRRPIRSRKPHHSGPYNYNPRHGMSFEGSACTESIV